MINRTAPLTFTGPIAPAARRRAEQFCRQQATPQKGFQVRLNTLSVSFVDSYLQCMGFETDLENSDSWNPLHQTLLDIADLELKNLGKLECRPMLEGTKIVYVPPEVASNRLGYLVVQISQSLREATLLGFVKNITTNSLSINQLHPLENLLEYLEKISQVNISELAPPSNVPSKTLVKLEQWYENNFEVGWDSIKALLGTQPDNLALSLRSTQEAHIWRGKLIDLGIQHQSQSVILAVALTSKNEQERDILVEVHPKKGHTYLPSHLQLMLLDDLGEAVMEATARSANSYIQLQFSASPREYFSVKVTLGDVSVIENFVI